MNRHFELAIMYGEKPIEIIVQCLSEELPLMYAVWPKDEALKNSFDESFVLFTQNVTLKKGELPTTWNKVHYSKHAKSTNLEFEIAVWNELLKLESIDNSHL